MINYEGDIWTLFLEGDPLFSPRDAVSLCLPNNDEFLNVTVVGGVSGPRLERPGG